ncbi:TetR/AcrR family transcriptional regulator [Rhodobacter sp. KR11]|uniref:TetR/AcrR family transcriptional regulator n=1 Tax=Rhodobacter sp. KR11 TaxID=2974588 RepID=UPI0022228E8D|nr:TetR/AcrR family transcriptional regulator [Rhodobacter sp. KR11]MCW1917319.1 TetR/AcrR family transcriptional regulator [Rhodobacter sp. KR11]
MGLRAKHKAERETRILDAALDLFREAGFDAVRIEDIAARAEVSAGTVYNYFATKGDVLLALVSLEVEEVLDQGAAVVACPPQGLAAALDALVGGYYAHSLTWLTKDLWRQAIALTIGAPGTRFSLIYAGLDDRLRAQVSDLLAACQTRGQMRPGLQTAPLADVIFGGLNQAFTDFVRVEEMQMATLLTQMQARNTALAVALG